jgi:hypothetical protein
MSLPEPEQRPEHADAQHSPTLASASPKIRHLTGTLLRFAVQDVSRQIQCGSNEQRITSMSDGAIISRLHVQSAR